MLYCDIYHYQDIKLPISRRDRRFWPYGPALKGEPCAVFFKCIFADRIILFILFASFCSTPFCLFLFRCPVFKRLKEEAERKKKPSWKELKVRNGEGELSHRNQTSSGDCPERLFENTPIPAWSIRPTRRVKMVQLLPLKICFSRFVVR